MSFTDFDNPGVFFNQSATTFGYYPAVTAGYQPDTGFITLGTVSSATDANRLLLNLTDDQADLLTGSTTQVIFALLDMIVARYQQIPVASRPVNLSANRISWVEQESGDIINTYTVKVRLAATGLIAVNT